MANPITAMALASQTKAYSSRNRPWRMSSKTAISMPNAQMMAKA